MFLVFFKSYVVTTLCLGMVRFRHKKHVVKDHVLAKDTWFRCQECEHFAAHFAKIRKKKSRVLWKFKHTVMKVLFGGEHGRSKKKKHPRRSSGKKIKTLLFR